MIDTIEQALLAQLKAGLSGVEVRSFPERPEEFRPQGAQGSVLLRYLGAKLKVAPELGANVAQSLAEIPGAQELRFEVALVTRGLKDHRGAYGLIEAVRSALVGFEPPGASEVWPAEDGFAGHENGLWYHYLHFTLFAP